MFRPACSLGKTPTDPTGCRWDGIQFLIDTAGPDDRIALIIYRGTPLVTRYLDASGFVTLGTDDNRRQLKKMVAEFQKPSGTSSQRPRSTSGRTDGYPIRVPGMPEALLKFDGAAPGAYSLSKRSTCGS